MATLDMTAQEMMANDGLDGARERMNRKTQRERDIIEWIKDNVDLTVYKHEPLDKEKVCELLESINDDLRQDTSSQSQPIDPVEMMRDKITDYLTDCYEDWLYDEVHKAAKNLAKTFGMDDDLEEAKDWIQEYASPSFPVDQYLHDKYRTLVVLDTGDSDYDFSLNQVEPAYHGDDIEDISAKASILWLAEQNGYTKEKFIDLMKNIDKIPEGEHPFIKSVYQELENTSSSMNAVVFLGEMTLGDLAKAQAEGVTIPKRASCGLFDGWYGASGTISVELQKDIVIPKDVIFSVAPDCNDAALQYSIDYTCDFTQKVWDTPLYAGEAKPFEPEQIDQAKALCEIPPRVPEDEDTPLGYMQQNFAGAFRNNLFSNQRERIYDGMLDRGQFVKATNRALDDLYYRTHMDGREEYRFSEKYLREMLKIAPAKLPKEMIDSHLKHFDMVRRWNQGR